MTTPPCDGPALPNDVSGYHPLSTEDLSTRDRLILTRRWEGRSLDEIGREVGLTREGVRQVLLRVGGPSAADVRATLARQRQERQAARQRVVRQWLVDNGPATVQRVAAAIHLDPETVRRVWPPDLTSYRMHKQTASRRWSDADVLETIREAATFEYPLRMATYDKLIDLGEISGPKAVRVMQVFGTWRRACKLAGVEALPPRREAYNSSWTDDDLLAYVREYLDDSGQRGTFADFDVWLRGRDGGPSAQTIRNRLGAWNHVKAQLHRGDR